jgi:hypothetical protein|tara:strand:- start:676 stop:834 length:159 start_codon:yes stop_codon:yes gene_type:complete
MKTIIFILSLFGASTDKNIDATSMIVNKAIKGVYDESRDKTMETFVQKHPKN